MSFSKYFKGNLLAKEEEVYDIKYTSEEKKVDFSQITPKVVTPNQSDVEDALQLKLKEQKVLVKNKLSNPDLARNIEGSFSSFGNKSAEQADKKVEESYNFLQNINARKESSPKSEKKKSKNKKDKIDNASNLSSGSNNNSTKNKGATKVVVDDSTFDVLDYQGKISDEDIKNAGVLLLEEVTGDLMKNTKVKINAAGLINGLRKMRDGIAFFGKNSDGILNDFDLTVDNGTNQGPHSLIIYYKKEMNKFYLKSYRDKVYTGQVHIKIDPYLDFAFSKKEVVLLSENYFQITPCPNGVIEVQNLGVNTNRESANSKYTFSPDEVRTATIGRDKKCTISFPGDKSFSKVQATLNYDSTLKCWKIKDGTSLKPSTNGCWIYAIHSFEIHDNTLFQFGNSRFRITCL